MKPSMFLTPHQLAVEAFQAITKELGASKALAYVLQYEQGQGDYTQERKELLKDISVDQALRAVKHARSPEAS
jgi:hypothetical protein